MKALIKSDEKTVVIISENRLELAQFIRYRRIQTFLRRTDAKIWFSLKKAVFYIKFKFDYESERRIFMEVYRKLRRYKYYKTARNKDTLRAIGPYIPYYEAASLAETYQEEHKIAIYNVARHYARLEVIHDLL